MYKSSYNLRLSLPPGKCNIENVEIYVQKKKKTVIDNTFRVSNEQFVLRD